MLCCWFSRTFPGAWLEDCDPTVALVIKGHYISTWSNWHFSIAPKIFWPWYKNCQTLVNYFSNQHEIWSVTWSSCILLPFSYRRPPLVQISAPHHVNIPGMYLYHVLLFLYTKSCRWLYRLFYTFIISSCALSGAIFYNTFFLFHFILSSRFLIYFTYDFNVAKFFFLFLARASIFLNARN